MNDDVALSEHRKESKGWEHVFFVHTDFHLSSSEEQTKRLLKSLSLEAAHGWQFPSQRTAAVHPNVLLPSMHVSCSDESVLLILPCPGLECDVSKICNLVVFVYLIDSFDAVRTYDVELACDIVPLSSLPCGTWLFLPMMMYLALAFLFMLLVV